VLLIDRFGTKHMQREGMASRDANGRGLLLADWGLVMKFD
jgi:hypothetical protein